MADITFHRMDTPCAVYSSVGGPMGDFHFLTIMNYAVLRFHVETFT